MYIASTDGLRNDPLSSRMIEAVKTIFFTHPPRIDVPIVTPNFSVLLFFLCRSWVSEFRFSPAY